MPIEYYDLGIEKRDDTDDQITVDTVEAGQMTKDLALCIYGKELSDSHYLTMEDFLNALRNNLEKA